MDNLTTISSTILTSFLASFVEIVEAFTIVLAVGLTNTWRSAFAGTALALIVLALMVVVLGPLLQLIPLTILQFIVGVLLGLFGMRWLRKAILRASGHIPLHDEEKAFREETEVLSNQRGLGRADYLAMIAAFKAVLLEGVEVVFIVIAVGSTHGLTVYASLGALIACIIVIGAGLLVHRPLARVPENSLKLVVGLMLTSFSIFWTGEGLGVSWPGEDFAIVVFFVILSAFSAVAINLLKSLQSNIVKEQTI
jgi:uncharacterized membrane protein